MFPLLKVLLIAAGVGAVAGAAGKTKLDSIFQKKKPKKANLRLIEVPPGKKLVDLAAVVQEDEEEYDDDEGDDE